MAITPRFSEPAQGVAYMIDDLREAQEALDLCKAHAKHHEASYRFFPPGRIPSDPLPQRGFVAVRWDEKRPQALSYDEVVDEIYEKLKEMRSGN